MVFAMELNMALGLYHIPIEFYHSCWDVANADLCNLFSKLQENKLELGRLNYDVITLIPKVKEENMIKQHKKQNVLQSRLLISKIWMTCLSLLTSQTRYAHLS